MITINLLRGGRTYTYTADAISMGTTLEAYELFREYTRSEGDYTEDFIRRLNEFVCALFGEKFTPDELLDGYTESAFALYPNLLGDVVGYTHDTISNFPKPVTVKSPKPAKKAN